jgi:hypothetical protein
MKNCLLRNNLRKWNDSDARHQIATCDSGRVTGYPEVPKYLPSRFSANRPDGWVEREQVTENRFSGGPVTHGD